MCSARHLYATRTENGRITRIRHDPDPALANLVPDTYWEQADNVLHLVKADLRQRHQKLHRS
jgi:hypothetical protein